MGVEVIKQRSAVPGAAREALGSNSAPAWWRFSFWVPKERAFLGGRVSYVDPVRGVIGENIYLSTPGASFEERNLSWLMPSSL
jgi:hypothetical protein